MAARGSNRLGAILVCVVLLLTAAAGCERGRVGGRCRGSGWGDDGGAWIVRCRGGRWVRVLTKADYIRLLTTASTTTTPAPPPSTSPPPTTAPSTTTTLPALPAWSTRRASLAIQGLNGEVPNGSSEPIGISGDGRYLLTYSSATNLTSERTSGLFLRDRQSSSNVFLGNVGSARLAATGDFVALTTADALLPGDTDGFFDVYRWQRSTSAFTLVSVAASTAAYNTLDISGDGRFVLFASTASDLVTGDTNGGWDVFVRDVVNSTTARVNLADDESQIIVPTGGDASMEGAISEDGRFIVFSSRATNLRAADTDEDPDLFVRDRQNGTTTPITPNSANGFVRLAGVSADGRTVLYFNAPGDFLQWRAETASATLVPRASADGYTGGYTGAFAGQAGLSPDGRFVAIWGSYSGPFGSTGPWLEVHDRVSGQSKPVAAGTACGSVGGVDSPFDVYPINTGAVLCSAGAEYITPTFTSSDWMPVLWPTVFP